MKGNIVKLLPNSASKPYVLIVEDDSTTLSVYKGILQSLGGRFRIKCFTDARQALYFLEKEIKCEDTVFAILLDIHMPHLNAWQFLDIIQRFKEFNHSPPLVWLCSADSSSYTFKKSLEQAYVDRFVQKPLEWHHLKEFSEKVDEISPGSQDGKPTKTGISSPKNLFHLMRHSDRFSHYPKMKKKPIEQIILNVRSQSDLEMQVGIYLDKYEDPIYQSLVLLDFFHTLEEFIIKVIESDDAKKEALFRILMDYLVIIDRLWIQRNLQNQQKSRSFYERYKSEYQLFEFRHLSIDS